MKNSWTEWAIALVIGLVGAQVSVAHAVTACKVKVNARNGTLDVSAKGVSGVLTWGDRPGGPYTSTFYNAATCVSGGAASKCELGAPGSPEAIIPPDLCTFYLKDDGAECAAYVKGCTPGPRPTTQAKADALKELVNAIEFHHSVPTVVFKGVNVQLVSGAGATDAAPNGSGNLIVGYDETYARCLADDTACTSDGDCPLNSCNGGVCTAFPAPCSSDDDCVRNLCTSAKTGSHNVIVGPGHSYRSVGGIIGGARNASTAPFASVIGGENNSAMGWFSSVSGGHDNKAVGPDSSVAGGTRNTARGNTSSITGGSSNTAVGVLSSVSGGSTNRPAGWSASVSGGAYNNASGEAAAVCGGSGNLASGRWATVSGGGANRASGDKSSVSGGLDNEASGGIASVSGGESVTALTLFEWHAGQSNGFPTGTQY